MTRNRLSYVPQASFAGLVIQEKITRASLTQRVKQLEDVVFDLKLQVAVLSGGDTHA